MIEILKKDTLSEQDRKRVKELQEIIEQLPPGERRIFNVTLQDRAVQRASKTVTAGVNTGDCESGMACGYGRRHGWRPWRSDDCARSRGG